MCPGIESRQQGCSAAPLGRASCRTQSGVGLIEVVVALVIFGLVAFAVLPDVSLWIRGLAIRNTGDAIKAGLERARMEALRRNAPVSFWLVTQPGGGALNDSCAVSANGASWVISIQSPDGKCSAMPSVTADPLLVDKWAASEGGRSVVVTATDSNGAPAPQVIFNSLGQVASTVMPIATVEISHADGGARNLRIVVDVGGAVRMCDPNAGAGDPRRCL